MLPRARWPPPCWPELRPGFGIPRLSASAADCTTSHHKTHSTASGDKVTVVYAWHPWAGRPVRRHEVIERATGASARCSLVDATIARQQEIPVWMLDAVACRTARTTAQPVAALSALAALRALLSDAMRHDLDGRAIASPESCGDRHAAPLSPASKAAPSTRPRSDKPAGDASYSAGLVRSTGAGAADADGASDPPARRARQRRSEAGCPTQGRRR